MEYAVAAYFGAKRRAMRKFYLQGPDVNQEFADLEVKTRKHIPKWLLQPLRKTQEWSKSKISAVIYLNPDTDAVRDGIVVMGVPDFKTLLDSYGEKTSHQSASAPSSAPQEIPSKSPAKAKARYRWRSRRLTSRKFSN